MRCRLIVFRSGRRIEKPYDDHREAVTIAKKLRKSGVKCRIATNKILTTYRFPPAEDDLSSRLQGKLWCPYCRDWSFFKVPNFTKGAQIGTTPWFLNSAHRQGLKVCAWCLITEMDFGVRQANNTWGERSPRRRRKRRVA